MNELLEIHDLHVEIGEKEILTGVNLDVPKGEVHAIMGPNGSGKSTLVNAMMGHPDYSITGGDIRFDGKSILELETDERARRGIFLGFQYPVPLPGISLLQLIKKSTSLIPGTERHVSVKKFVSSLGALSSMAGVPEEMFSRSVNDGFSGGEMKKAEILQMGMVKSRLTILDEIDSGLDIDALKGVAAVVNSLRNAERSFLFVTHYQRILSDIHPDRVHVMQSGCIVRSGDADLALELEEVGYGNVEAAS